MSSDGIFSGRKMPVVHYAGKSNTFWKYIGDKCSINICSNRTEFTLLFFMALLINFDHSYKQS